MRGRELQGTKILIPQTVFENNNNIDVNILVEL